MFRTLAKAVTVSSVQPVDAANAVLATHPMQLSRWLEEVWSGGGLADPLDWAVLLKGSGAVQTDVFAQDDVIRTIAPKQLLQTMLSGIAPNVQAGLVPPQPYMPPSPPTGPAAGLKPTPLWEHMLYAFLVESTGIFEIFGEVVRRYSVGETLPIPRAETVAYVRSTEELFYRDPPVFTTSGAIMSHLRPDAAVNRRNAYWRMFGMDLPHPVGRGVQGQPWKRDVGPTGNARFLELWNELLRQVWLGYENDTNTSGPKATDSSYVGYLCQTLGEMLRLRRQGGMLAREEYAFVTMLSWFHLTVEQDTAIVHDLSATAGPMGNPADRLAAIGARVGIAPSRQSRELFELADLISPVLWCIELRLFDSGSNAELLYKHSAPGNVIAQAMNRIIDLWQSATGERVKDLAVTTRSAGLPPRTAQPTRLLPGPLVPTAGVSAARTAAPPVNGRRPTLSRP